MKSENRRLVWFPRLFPDETVFGAAARYKILTGSTAPFVLKRLFDTRTVVVNHELPSYLAKLTDALPQDGGYNVEALVQGHTALPYYANFLPSQRVVKIITAMIEGPGSGIGALLGLRTMSSHAPERWCYECADVDVKEYGQPYWHREHQLPGIYVCSRHSSILRKFANGILSQKKELRLPTLNRTGVEPAAYPRAKDIAPLQKIALRSASLLGAGVASAEAQELHGHYISRCADLFPDETPTRRISDLLGECFGQLAGLPGFGFLDSEDRDRWVSDWFHRGRMTASPLKHIVLTEALSGSSENFAEKDKEQRVLQTKLNSVRTQRSAMPAGAKLNVINGEPDQARRLAIVKTLDENPTASIKQIQKLVPAAYIWLYRHDREWLRLQVENRRRVRTNNGLRKDWELRDAMWAAQVRKEAILLARGQEGVRPVKITRTRLIRSTGKQATIEKNLNRLTQTARALDGFAESDQRFVERRLTWAHEELERRGIQPAKWRVERLAAVRPSTIARALDEKHRLKD